MVSIRTEKVDFWLKMYRNVLLLGYSGVGKSALALEGFERAKLTNVATWSVAENKFIGCDLTEAGVVFFDDLNSVQARLVAIEILTRRNWQGKALPATCVVWGCFTFFDNDQEEVIDAPPELSGRFDVSIEIPLDLPEGYFTEKFGDRMTNAVKQWWDGLPNHEKQLAPPRKIEAALKMYCDNGDMRDVLPPCCNVSKLATLLNVGRPYIIPAGEEASQEVVRGF